MLVWFSFTTGPVEFIGTVTQRPPSQIPLTPLSYEAKTTTSINYFRWKLIKTKLKSCLALNTKFHREFSRSADPTMPKSSAILDHCDTVIYKIFGLHLQLLFHGSRNPWNFPSDENDKGVFCYVNEVSWKHLRMGAHCQENQPCD